MTADAKIMELCEHCQKGSTGLFTKGNYCCEVRALAGMPKFHRQAQYDKVRREQGDVAAKQLANDVSEAYKRKIALKK